MSLDISFRKTTEVEVFESNITHNLGKMATELGVYALIWRHEESGVESAACLLGPVAAAIDELRTRPEHYDQFDAANGWGTRVHMMKFLQEIQSAAREHPDATVHSRR